MAGKYIDEVGREYLEEVLAPRLKERLIELGLAEDLKEEITFLENHVKENPYSKIHLEVIKAVFEANAGTYFLERLNEYTQDTQQVTESVWDDTLSRIHFLPMESGENIIEFSPDSLPRLLGLKTITMARIGSLKDWQMSTVFEFENAEFVLYSMLDQDGKLEFKGPVAREMPGLYAMLNHIAVLTFHDLVVQEKKERETGTTKPKERIDNGDKPHAQSPDSVHRTSLPRRQYDRELIGDIYIATGCKPRRVDLHRTPLGRSENYLDAVTLYQDTINQNGSQDEISAAKEILDEARKRMYRISDQKKRSIPAKFSLRTQKDPVTKEELYLETWVVEHTSPKPTTEELASPLQLFKRYYKGSSALAFLDQMKPWFVGQ